MRGEIKEKNQLPDREDRKNLKRVCPLKEPDDKATFSALYSGMNSGCKFAWFSTGPDFRSPLRIKA
jgi:hypothetical protein